MASSCGELLYSALFPNIRRISLLSVREFSGQRPLHQNFHKVGYSSLYCIFDKMATCWYPSNGLTLSPFSSIELISVSSDYRRVYWELTTAKCGCRREWYRPYGEENLRWTACRGGESKWSTCHSQDGTHHPLRGFLFPNKLLCKLEFHDAFLLGK